MADGKQVATTLDEQIEAKIAPDGTVTVKLISNEQMIRDIDFAQTMVEFAANEYFWSRYADETRRTGRLPPRGNSGRYSSRRGLTGRWGRKHTVGSARSYSICIGSRLRLNDAEGAAGEPDDRRLIGISKQCEAIQE